MDNTNRGEKPKWPKATTVISTLPNHWPTIPINRLPRFQMNEMPYPSMEELSDEDVSHKATPRHMLHRKTIAQVLFDISTNPFVAKDETEVKPKEIVIVGGGGGGGREDVENNYVGMSYDFGIVPDPEDNPEHYWIQRSTTRLYVFWILNILLTAAFTSFVILFLDMIPKVYSQAILYIIFIDGSYANIYIIIPCHFIINMMALINLCYPNRFSWGRLHNTRWVLMIIPNIILGIALLDQFYWLINFRDLKYLLQENMITGLDVTKQTTLTTATQTFFKCCGINDSNDWIPLLSNNQSIHFGGYPKSCCTLEYIRSCSVPVKAIILKDPFRTPHHQLWSQGCYDAEVQLMATGAISCFCFIFIMTILCGMATLNLWWVIRHINLHDLIVYHPFT